MVSVMRVSWCTSYGKSTLKFQEVKEMLKRSGSLMKRLMRGMEGPWQPSAQIQSKLNGGRGTRGRSQRGCYAKPYAP